MLRTKLTLHALRRRRDFYWSDLPLKKYKFHPTANIFPLRADGPEFEAPVEDIKRIGLLHPIVLHDGNILDGRRRYLACQKAKVEPRFVNWDGRGLPVEYVRSMNVLRQHWTPSQLALAAFNSLPFYQEQAKDQQRLSKGRGQKGGEALRYLKGQGD